MHTQPLSLVMKQDIGMAMSVSEFRHMTSSIEFFSSLLLLWDIWPIPIIRTTVL